ncbi:unnamed protein product [Scytosiphon promiscuus]
MLRAWNDENVNQVGPTQRGLGGGKSLKALGDAGLGSSENLPSAPGKGTLKQQHQQRKLKPLGCYSENAPLSTAKGKGPGLGTLANSSSKPQALKQRRALVDISNAGKGASAGLGGAANASSKPSGKQPTPGLKFAVHSDSRGFGGTETARAKSAKAPVGGGRFKSKVTVRRRNVVGPDGRVDDVEMLLGRTGDEEELLVERKMEQRAALKYARPHGHSAIRSNRPRSRSTAPSFPKATSASRSKPKFGRDITNTAAASGFGDYDASTCDAGGGATGVNSADKSLDSAIDCILRDDFEDARKGLTKTADRAALEEPDLDMEAVAMALEALEEDTSPLDLIDDNFDDFDTNDLDISFT